MSEDSQSTQPNPPNGVSRDTFEGNRMEDVPLQQIHSQLLREKEEPTENFSPMPLTLMAMCAVLIFWAGLYLAWYSGDLDPFRFDETQRGASGIADAPREIDMLALGRRVYNQNCVACHQSDGRGQSGVFPPLVAADWVQEESPDRIIKVVLAGLAGPILVNGNPYNNAMTAFNRLSDRDIAAVLTFIRTEPTWQNNAPAVTPEMVAAVRAEFGGRTEPWTGPELEAIHGPVSSR